MQVAAFLLYSHVVERAISGISSFSCKGTNPTIRDPALDIIQSNYLTEAPRLDTITLKLGLQLQEDKMQSVTVILSFVSFFLCGVGLGWNIYMYTCINVCV